MNRIAPASALANLRAAFAFLSIPFALYALVPAAASTACKGATCTSDEESACNQTHATCVGACGDGTITGPDGLPTPDPNYKGCVKTCDDDLCSCLDKCGDTCHATSNGNPNL